MPVEEEPVKIRSNVSIYSQKEDEKMSKEFMSQMTRPEEGQKGLGFGHRRGGTGRASYRRPPEDRRSEGLVKALDRVESPTSKAPGAKRKVESMRDKGAKRTASGKLHIDDGCMGGGEDVKYKSGNIRWVSPSEGSPALSGDENDFLDYKNKFFDNTNRTGIFHYCLIVDHAEFLGETYPGLAFTPGDDFMLSGGDISSYSSSNSLSAPLKDKI